MTSFFFYEGLFGAVIKGTNYDSAKTHKFMLESVTLLMKAVTAELAYNLIKGYDSAIHAYNDQWISRFSHIRTTM